MEPALIGTRLASAAIGPLLRKLLVKDGPGAGLTGDRKPVRLSRLVSFRGEQRTLTDKDVRKLAATLVERSLTDPGEPPFPADETEALTDTLAATLVALGDLDMDDVQAVRLGHRDLARHLRAAAPAPDGLSTDSALFLDSLVEWACLHILNFFTQRSTFVARTLVEQTRGQAELIAKVDELIRRTPRVDGGDPRDAAFERRYLAYLAKKHGSLTIYGVDLRDAPEKWPLDVAYLSLEATDSWFAEQAAAIQATEWLDLGSGRRTAFHRDDLLGGRADQVLARHDKVLLRGIAGSGKTTLVQWLTISAAAEHENQDGQGQGQGQDASMAYLRDRIPFVLPLRTLTRHGERLPAPERFLSAVGCPLTAPEGWADRVLAAGRGLILVDGIDEIPEAERDRARRWLRDLLDTYDTYDAQGGNRWLVTSRPTAVRDDWLSSDGFTELTLSPMSAAEVTTFVRRWHQAAGPGAAPYEQPLLDALRTTADVAQLATNPLMCGLICALHRSRRGFLPRGRKPLYDAALSMLLSRRDRERDMGTPYGIELGEAPQIRLIQRLAYWLTLNGRTQMDRSHAESVVRSAVPAITEAAAYDPGAVFTHLLHRSGLLREPTADTVDFVHRTFQDYLAAKALVDDWHIGVLVAHAADDQWEDVIRMAVGHARPRECAEIFDELLKRADAAPDRRTQLRILVVAATALEEATEVSPEIRERILARTAEVIPPRDAEEARELASVGRAVLDLLPGPDGLTGGPGLRHDEEALMVVTTASHITDDAALPYLARFARHDDLGIRSQLMWAWSRFDTRSYAEEIIAQLDPDGLDFTLSSDAQVHELVRLGLRPEFLDLRVGLSDHGMAALGPVLATAGSLSVAADVSWSLESVPVENRLRALHMASRPREGLGSLTALKELAVLSFYGFDALSEQEWSGLRMLERMQRLLMDASTLRSCPDTIRLPRVRSLHLRAERLVPPFALMARTFPGLHRLVVTGIHHSHTHDLAALASLEHLARVSIPGADVTGTEHLPPTVQVLT
ncbi:NACHT domain-containing protein [Streptomyces vilmorinianum]|uniref:NACHT domain-containing protein n=1 Tax=Streptomyces vilmorinianum TaxID=3051092 RepID=UPI0010FB4A0D|nr:NACHT domain-containing protein [Streptomyces vilmorinianum]